MTNASFVQSSFLGGEWSPFMQGRYDLPSYKAAMNVSLNGFPVEEGAWPRRPGTRFAATTRNGAKGRVLQFDFQKNTPYNLELTDGFMRFYDGLGSPATLILTGATHTITNISAVNPATFTTGDAHGWVTNNQIQLLFDASLPPAALAILRHRQFGVTLIDATHFALFDPITGMAVDGTTLGWLASYVVTAQQVLEVATPWSAGIWDSGTLRMVQANLQGIFLNASIVPYVLQATLNGANPTTFALNAATFIDGPFLDPVVNSKATPSALTGTITLAVTNFTRGFVAADVGRQIRLFSEPLTWAVGTAYLAGDDVTFNGAYYQALSNQTGNRPDTHPTIWALSTNLAIWTWGLITVINSASNVSVLIKGPDLFYTTQMNTWRLGVYGAENGYPTCGTFHEGRLYLAGAIANRFDASTSTDLFTFSPTAPDGTVGDSNGISEVFNASDSNNILWMLSDPAGVLCGTQAGEWLIQTSSAGIPITPTSIQAHRVTRYGCANVEPARTGLTIAFVQRYQRKLFEYFADVFSNRFTAPNLSFTARHLTKQRILELAFQQEPAPIIWARCGDGSLIGVTYKRESLFSTQGPTFVGWHRHTLGSGRVVESICKSSSLGVSAVGTLDTLAMVTNDPMTNVRHVEVMTDLFDDQSMLTDAQFVDDAVPPSGGTLSATNLVLNGMWHLTGKIASVVIGGLDCGDFLVAADGTVTVPLQSDPGQLLTTAYLNSVSALTYGDRAVPISPASAAKTAIVIPAVVGFTFTSDGQVLRPATKDDSGAQQGPAQGKTRRLHQFTVMLNNACQGIKFGTVFSKLRPAIFKSKGGTTLPNNQMFSGIFESTIEDDYSFDGMLCWRISRPLPATVVSVGGFISTQDR